ncbi:hypothetical protein EOL94_03635 [bacterium]|nr:hypothetical protein [bacterium]
MPNMDGKGPQGKGPLTGRGMGNCEGANKDENFGRGMGRGCRGCRRGFFGRRRANNSSDSE